MLTAPLLLAAALAPADAPTPPPDAAVGDARELQGEWEVVGCIINGGDETSLYKGERWTFAGPAAQRTRANPYEVRADPSARPMTLDLTTRSGKVRRGICRLSGDEMLWVNGFMRGGGRPSSFDPASGVIVWTLRRVRK